MPNFTIFVTLINEDNMNFTEYRLRFRRFFRKYKRVLLVILIVWAIIFFINKIVGNLNNGYSREVTYEPHVGIISSLHEVPNSTQSSIEDIMEEYMMRESIML